MRRIGIFALALLTLTLALTSSPSGASTGYFIGNSLTYGIGFEALEELSALAGKPLSTGHHIRGGRSLDYIQTNPEDFSRADPAPFATALPAASYNFLSLQPYHFSSTLAREVDAATNLISLAAGSPTVFLYQVWPSLSQIAGDYASFWNGTVENLDDTVTTHKRQYFEHTLTRLRLANPNQEFLVVPAGEVLYRLDEEFRAGTFPGFSSVSDIYADNQHLSEDTGAWLLANIVFASLFNQSPEGLSRPSSNDDGITDFPVTEEAMLQLQAIIWEEVSYNRLGLTAIPIPPSVLVFLPALVPVLRRRLKIE